MTAETLGAIKIFASEEYTQSKDRQHDFGHVERVAQNALWIADTLGVGKKMDINLLQAACYLHDVVIARRGSRNRFEQLYHHLFEKPLNKKDIGNVLVHLTLAPEEKRILKRAIVNHPYSIPYRILNRRGDLYTKILQDADTLDYVSPIRKHIFVMGRKKILTHFVNFFLSRIKKNIGTYLNFPELADRVNGKTL